MDRIVEQWGRQRPDLDVSPMEVFGRLSRATNLARARMARTFAEHGLDGPSFDMLATLRRSDAPHGLTPAELMRASMVTSGAISQRLDKLEVRGLVTRRRGDADARNVYVALTEAGRALIDAALPDHVATEEAMLSALSAAQCKALETGLRALLESLGDAD